MKVKKYNFLFVLSIPFLFIFSLPFDIKWLLGSSQQLSRLETVSPDQYDVVRHYTKTDEWMLAYSPFGQIDLNYYYWDTYETSKSVDHADVVFLGRVIN